MSDLAEVTGASPVIVEYYQTLLEASPRPQQGVLVALTHLLIGTCGVDDRGAAFLCTDTSVRVFAPQILKENGFEDEAYALSLLGPITDEASSYDAKDVLEHTGQSGLDAWRAAWCLTKPICGDHLIDAGRHAARSAVAASDLTGGIQLFRDLCDLPRAHQL